MDIQSGIYGNYQKVLDENGKEVWRRTGGGSSVDLSAYPTREEMKAYAPQKLTADLAIHIDPSHANASDTLDEGRGLSTEKPFKTLDAALMRTLENYFGPYRLYFLLHSDTEHNLDKLSCSTVSCVVIKSADSSQNIALKKPIWLASGNLLVQGVSITTPEPIDYIFAAGGWMRSGYLCVHTIELNNVSVSNAVIYADTSGVITIYGGTAITGTATGKRYSAFRGGMISLNGRDPNFIPGTIAGTCDETSVVA